MSFIRKEHVIAILFDLEKACDTTEIWHFKGPIRWVSEDTYPFTSIFLSRKQFQVQIGAAHSTSYLQELGVPQGNILLFYWVLKSIA